MSVYEGLLSMQYASVVLTLFMCAYIAKRWTKPLHGWLFVYCVSTLVNNAGYLALMHAQTAEAAYLLWRVCYLGRVWIPFALLEFVLLLCGKRLARWVPEALAALHALTYFIVLGMDHNTIYYTSIGFTQEGIFPHVIHDNGPWHYGYDALITGYIVYGLANLFQLLRAEQNPRKRRQYFFIIAAIFTDCVFYILELFHLMPGFDLTTMGFTFAAVFLYLAIFRYDMLGARELALDFVVDRVSEGVVITDENGMVVDYNQKAKALLPSLETDPQAALDELLRLIADKRALEVEGRKYTPKENQLMNEQHVAGMVYMLSDDTAHYRRTERLTREMMLALSKTVDAKDHYTNGHSQRVAAYSREIARRMGKSLEEQEAIYEMGLLHDIGKIGVSEEVLNKTSRLTDEEFAHIKEHTVIGSEILQQISAMPELAIGARSHHERYDGHGYPDGLAGTDIPEEARIICLADCYDAMTSTRTYSTPKPQAAVRAEIERCKGSQFDPEIADVMISIIDDDPDYQMHE